MLGKVDYQGGHSSLFSGSQMMHVVTEKQNGGPPMSWRKLQSQQIIQFALFTMSRALTPLFGNGAGAHGIGKISGVLTKIGKFDIVLMYDSSIARLIPMIKLTFFLDI